MRKVVKTESGKVIGLYHISEKPADYYREKYGMNRTEFIKARKDGKI